MSKSDAGHMSSFDTGGRPVSTETSEAKADRVQDFGLRIGQDSWSNGMALRARIGKFRARRDQAYLQLNCSE